ncbi:L-threonylcarbamoyladenylate synthase [Enemella evansiae]|uniref:Threonylcarbamoyl-AMP synthase n=1 Tax=Enemella evansiae TaxID=2016499 RepID=A0A255G3Q9_9ACTN|nr:L-threonylcarbamoyladenylate synthase [Enemella evansiae]OYN98214.1 threonylcarbamoyl-AMP synthase [Enemella evansiae]OYO05400.1 threonylcarbamoyl-AMP synthase [Enemella evansiae]OYO10550.1 threonylcarbamoyl-AMP synthase [Enemella evansiae]OYO15400.1 threonylcarbamoyl-AMP synthase [Enemella evansiae]OYO20455.1 threonylcarbamoyl-AMP synthase [Enemella evansiae]
MARYFDVHPDNPQPRALGQVVQILTDGGLVAYPTDSGFALGCRLGNKDGLDRIRRIRQLDDKHHFTLVCKDFAQLGQFVQMDNDVFRAVKAATPGQYTFILEATKEVPKQMLHPKKKTVGVRIPDHRTTLALLDALGEPLMSSTLILPGRTEPMTEGWEINEELGNQVDAVLDSGDVGTDPTTVVNFVGDEVTVDRAGAGDPSPFQE